MKSSPRLPLWQAIFCIVGSSLFISGGAYQLIHAHKGKKTLKGQAEFEEVISFIVQTGLQKEALHSDYLAELLDLSTDRPTKLKEFDEKLAQQKLLRCPLFQDVMVKKIVPNMIYIDYTVRKPMAWASDFSNVALDKEGYVFPISPFFSPKQLPEIYLGQEALEEIYGEASPSLDVPLQGRYLTIALSLLQQLKEKEKESFRVKRVDVSKAFSSTLGKRGIVVVIENRLSQGVSHHFLRLTAQGWEKEITHYRTLRPHLIESEEQKIALGAPLKDRVVDLRISQLAFVDE